MVLGLWFLAARAQCGSPAEQPDTVPGNFVDVTAASGVQFHHYASQTAKKYMLEIMGSGVALFDYDNDGRLDIFLVNGAPISDPTPVGAIPRKTDPKYWNRLYHQKPDGTFEDVTERAGVQGKGYGYGVAVGDYDNDGYRRLVCHRIRGQPAVPQQRQRNVHRCHGKSGRGRQRLVHQRGLGRPG